MIEVVSFDPSRYVTLKQECQPAVAAFNRFYGASVILVISCFTSRLFAPLNMPSSVWTAWEQAYLKRAIINNIVSYILLDHIRVYALPRHLSESLLSVRGKVTRPFYFGGLRGIFCFISRKCFCIISALMQLTDWNLIRRTKQFEENFKSQLFVPYTSLALWFTWSQKDPPDDVITIHGWQLVRLALC